MKKYNSIVIALILIFCMSFASYADTDSTQVVTDKNIKHEFTLQRTIWAGSDPTSSYVLIHDKEAQETKRATILSFVSSKPSVLKAYEKLQCYDGDNYESVWFLKPLKPGKVTVTVTYDDGNGIKTLKKKTTVKKYPGPIKSLKLNNKKINTKKHKFRYSIKNYEKDKVSIKMSIKKGWRMTDAFAWRISDGKEIKLTKKKLNKGCTLSIPEDCSNMYISINLYNKKNEYFAYMIDISRPYS